MRKKDADAIKKVMSDAFYRWLVLAKEIQEGEKRKDK